MSRTLESLQVCLDLFTDDSKFLKLLDNPDGSFFLYLRSIMRKNLIDKLLEDLHLRKSGRLDEKLSRIFLHSINKEELIGYIKRISAFYALDSHKVEYLLSQLLCVKEFEWGGFYQNSLERTLISEIKQIDNYSSLLDKFEQVLSNRVKLYISCSWYNHWSSILIENCFHTHPNIIPALGKIKKIDFFWGDLPFDLKVTYLPQAFIDIKRKKLGLKSETSSIKKFCKERNISLPEEITKLKSQVPYFSTRVMEMGGDSEREFLSEHILKIRQKIIKNIQKNVNELVIWLYENQGERRFETSPRFFLILIDKNKLEESWKLKRHYKLLNISIQQYLNQNDANYLNDPIYFQWKNSTFKTFAKTLLVIK